MTLDIEIGSTEGQYFTQWRMDDLRRIAEELSGVIDGENWKLWYDSHEDYHRLEFDCEGHHYTIQYYKVFTVARDNVFSYEGDDAKKNFGRSSWAISQMFKSGRFRTWSEKR